MFWSQHKEKLTTHNAGAGLCHIGSGINTASRSIYGEDVYNLFVYSNTHHTIGIYVSNQYDNVHQFQSPWYYHLYAYLCVRFSVIIELSL